MKCLCPNRKLSSKLLDEIARNVNVGKDTQWYTDRGKQIGRRRGRGRGGGGGGIYESKHYVFLVAESDFRC